MRRMVLWSALAWAPMGMAGEPEAGAESAVASLEVPELDEAYRRHQCLGVVGVGVGLGGVALTAGGTAAYALALGARDRNALGYLGLGALGVGALGMGAGTLMGSIGAGRGLVVSRRGGHRVSPLPFALGVAGGAAGLGLFTYGLASQRLTEALFGGVLVTSSLALTSLQLALNAAPDDVEMSLALGPGHLGVRGRF